VTSSDVAARFPTGYNCINRWALRSVVKTDLIFLKKEMSTCRLLFPKSTSTLTSRFLLRTPQAPIPRHFHLSSRQYSIMSNNRVHGDLNNTEVMRATNSLVPDPAYDGKTLAIPEQEDDKEIRAKYRPFITNPDVTSSDWISKSELSTALKLSEADMKKTGGDRLKILVLYGSLRERFVML
jgi:hypothetical protein